MMAKYENYEKGQIHLHLHIIEDQERTETLHESRITNNTSRPQSHIVRLGDGTEMHNCTLDIELDSSHTDDLVLHFDDVNQELADVFGVVTILKDETKTSVVPTARKTFMYSGQTSHVTVAPRTIATIAFCQRECHLHAKLEISVTSQNSYNGDSKYAQTITRGMVQAIYTLETTVVEESSLTMTDGNSGADLEEEHDCRDDKAGQLQKEERDELRSSEEGSDTQLPCEPLESSGELETPTTTHDGMLPWELQENQIEPEPSVDGENYTNAQNLPNNKAFGGVFGFSPSTPSVSESRNLIGETTYTESGPDRSEEMDRTYGIDDCPWEERSSCCVIL